MNADEIIRQRRSLGNWLFYAFPDEHEEDFRRTAPPPEIKEAGPPEPAQVEPPPGEASSDRLGTEP